MKNAGVIPAFTPMELAENILNDHLKHYQMNLVWPTYEIGLGLDFILLDIFKLLFRNLEIKSIHIKKVFPGAAVFPLTLYRLLFVRGDVPGVRKIFPLSRIV